MTDSSSGLCSKAFESGARCVGSLALAGAAVFTCFTAKNIYHASENFADASENIKQASANVRDGSENVRYIISDLKAAGPSVHNLTSDLAGMAIDLRFATQNVLRSSTALSLGMYKIGNSFNNLASSLKAPPPVAKPEGMQTTDSKAFEIALVPRQ